MVVDNDGVAIGVAIDQGPTTVSIGDDFQFSATVAGTANQQVTWSIVEGSGRGTIDAAGLYAAPASLPSPATATIQAACVADATVAATVVVTLTDGLGTEQQTALQQTFAATYDVSVTGSLAIDVCVQGVFTASLLNGGTPTFTGTITQQAAGSDQFTYSATPNDRLVVVLVGYPDYEIWVDAFDGYIAGTWEDFRNSHTDLRFTVTAVGIGTLSVQSVASKTLPAGAGSEKDSNVQFNRQITGQVLSYGVTLDVDITHSGFFVSEFSGGIYSFDAQDLASGTLSWAGGQMTISESYDYSLYDNYAHVAQTMQRRNGSSCTIGGTTYQYHNVIVNSEHRDHMINQPGYWIAQGTLTRNGAAFGIVRFNGPVIAGTAGPEAVLELTTGQLILLGGVLED